MLGYSDGGMTLKATLEDYTEIANGKRPDDFGKTVFPAKNFDPSRPFRETLPPQSILTLFFGGCSCNSYRNLYRLGLRWGSQKRPFFGGGAWLVVYIAQVV